MQAEHRSVLGSWARLGGLIAIVFVITMGSVDNASAAPFTSYLDGLIAELEARSEALEGSTDKDEIKLKKGIDKILKGFMKTSTGPDKDLKTAGKSVKKLVKLYPDEMVPGGGGDGDTLYDILEAALANFEGDIQALLDAAQGVVDSAPAGKCQDKAQATLDDVNEQLAALPGLPTLADVAKALGKALKSVFKGQALAEKALECIPKLKWWQSIGSVNVNGTPYAFYAEANDLSTDQLDCGFFPGQMNITMNSNDGMLSILFSANPAATGQPAQIFQNGTVTYDGGTYIIGPFEAQGSSVTLTKWPNPPAHVSGVFNLMATGVGGTTGDVNLTEGAFTIYAYPGF